ncbi:MAG: hypothetical protein KY463_02865 [Actinobacteria bacterium]|nr:hypothetical protein [Actinomycetota bacterium]
MSVVKINAITVPRERSEEDFQAWLSGPDFKPGHAQHRTGGAVGTSSELWSFDVLELEGPAVPATAGTEA